jgi:hypothetical protein
MIDGMETSDTTGCRALVARRDLHHLRLVPDPDAPAQRALADGEVRLAVRSFAFTANNITYAAFGEAMKYWQFYPASDADWGCIPVWGFADVVESRADGLAPGRRVYGFLPMGTHAVLRPGPVRAQGFADTSAHRAELAAVYNQYGFCDADPSWSVAQEPAIAVLRPLFTTSFLIDDFLADQVFFGADQLLLSSASSKTAWGTAFCLARRAARPRVLGLSSPANRAHAAGLGCYDEVLGYDTLEGLDPARPTVYVDFAGDAALRRRVHGHFGDALAYSCSVGGTHWEALGAGGGLPGPKPVLFFAPAQVKKRSGPPPEGWGPGGLQQRLGAAWQALMGPVHDPAAPWLDFRHHAGPAAVEAAYREQLEGRVAAREALVLSLVS